MSLADFKDGTVSLCITVTTELSLEDDFPAVARLLGVTQKELAGILDDGGLPDEPKDAAKFLKAMRRLGSVDSETIEFTDLSA